jgi:hypothetical protein
MDMNRTYRVALLLGLASLGATSLEAAVTDGPPFNGIHVMNNYQGMVRVYVEDAAGRLHRLGRVQKGELREFEIPTAVADQEFRVKIFPSQPAWALQQDDYGVKTNPLDVELLSHVMIWVEPDLSKSVVELARG